MRERRKHLCLGSSYQGSGSKDNLNLILAGVYAGLSLVDKNICIHKEDKPVRKVLEYKITRNKEEQNVGFSAYSAKFDPV